MHLEPDSPPSTWHPQDWLLIVEAVNYWIDCDCGASSYRRWRANKLLFRIAEYIDLSELEFEQQTDDRWGSRTRRT